MFLLPWCRFKHLFDDLQQKSQCCGANGPMDYNSTWWFRVSDTYFDEYEALLNQTTDKQARHEDGSASNPKQSLFPYEPVRHNVSYQRWDEVRNITTNTYVIEEETRSTSGGYMLANKGKNQNLL